MKTIINLKIFSSLFLGFMLLFLSTATFANKIYTFDPEHTYATWSVDHMGFSKVTGKLIISGTLSLDKDNLKNSKVNLKIRVAKMTTGIPRLDYVLKGKDYFDSGKYPTASFVSTKVDKTGADSAKIYGTLTIKNISKPMVLDVKLQQHSKHPFYQKDAYGFSGTATLNRSDFDMRAYIPGVSDKVSIEFQAEAIADFQSKH